MQYRIQDSTLLSVDEDTGILRVADYSLTDPKFVEVTVNAVDNQGVEPSLMSSALVKV